MTERNADGRFGKGHAKLPNAGRKKGTPNKSTRAVKDWLAVLVDRQDVQDAITERIKTGDAVAFFRALEQVIGRPVERQNVTFDGKVELTWKGWPK